MRPLALRAGGDAPAKLGAGDLARRSWRTRLRAAVAAAGLVAATAFAPSAASAQVPASQDRPTARADAQRWLQDAKFGVFLHWGLYSQLGGAGQSGLSEWAMEELRMPAASYERLAQFFHPSQYDADAWVRAFKAAGARYIVVTSKHHDGFAMFASKVSPYNVVDATPFRRDPLKELADACGRHGVKLFFYYSQLDWHHPDYFPRGRTGNHAGRPAAGDWDRYLEFQNAQLRELLTGYGPIGGIWFDGWWDQQHTAMEGRWRLQETYDLIHRLQPNALIVNNHHVTPFPGEDYQAFERDLPGVNTLGHNRAEVSSLPLEMAETMNGSWGFSLTDRKFKSTATLIRSLVGAAGRNSNFLLNTGPMPNGRIQPENLRTFAEIGSWLERYGESVYGTRAGPVAPRAWGVTTRRGKQVYVHVLNWAETRLPLPLAADVRSATDMRDGSAVQVRRRSGGLELALRPARDGDVDRVIRLTLR